MRNGAIVGVSDHGGWAVLVTATAGGAILDRRRVDLLAPGLPKIPHHSEGQRLPIDDAVALVERVRASADQYAPLALEAVATAVPGINGIALRQCPPLPPTIAECIRDYRASNLADWVMYRQALASAATQRGWQVHWFDSKQVFAAAAAALGASSIDAHFVHLRKQLGPPWNQDHKLATAAAIASAARTPPTLLR